VKKLSAVWRSLLVAALVTTFSLVDTRLLQEQAEAAPDSFKLPFPGGSETWDVINGYGQRTHDGRIWDEIYALDIGKIGSTQPAGKLVVAPVELTIVSASGGFPCGTQGVGVMAKMDGRPSTHYLKLCHFAVAPYKRHYNQGEPFVTDAEGKIPAVVYSQGTNSHIHMNLFSADEDNFDHNRQPIPFDSELGYRLEGLSLEPGETHECIKDKDGKSPFVATTVNRPHLRNRHDG
jgi:hypothetical protein